MQEHHNTIAQTTTHNKTREWRDFRPHFHRQVLDTIPIIKEGPKVVVRIAQDLPSTDFVSMETRICPLQSPTRARR
jgi:hypothetical protein